MEDPNFRQEPYIVDEFKTHFNFPYLALEDKVSGYVWIITYLLFECGSILEVWSQAYEP